jgi:hypothetical protein
MEHLAYREARATSDSHTSWLQLVGISVESADHSSSSGFGSYEAQRADRCGAIDGSGRSARLGCYIARPCWLRSIPDGGSSST